MKETKYRNELIVVLIFSCLMSLYGAFMNDRFVLIFFQLIFPLSFGVGLMWKEGRL